MYIFKHNQSALQITTCPALYRHAGLSLVELMVSITVGLMLLAGISALIVQQNGTSAELDKASRQIENGRYATQIIRDDVELAGYFGEFYELPDPAALANPCATDATTLQTAISLPIQGYDALSTLPTDLAACLSEENHLNGTDILVIRRADTTTIGVASAVSGQVYIQTGLNNSNTLSNVVGTGTDTSVFTLHKRDGSTAPLRRYLTHIYFISPCHRPASGSTCSGSSDDNGNPVPTLKRLELTVASGSAAFSLVPLAEGIQNVQFDYGLDTNGDGAPESYTAGTYSSGATAMTHTDWANTMTVRINVLARNLEPTQGHEDTKSYNLGQFVTVDAASDTYKRRVFTEIARATNPSGRRAQ